MLALSMHALPEITKLKNSALTWSESGETATPVHFLHVRGLQSTLITRLRFKHTSKSVLTVGNFCYTYSTSPKCGTKIEFVSF